jgi:hypothetical protein
MNPHKINNHNKQIQQTLHHPATKQNKTKPNKNKQNVLMCDFFSFFFFTIAATSRGQVKL